MYASYGARWRALKDRSSRATPRQPLRSLYIGKRAARARVLGCHCSCSLCRFASLSRRVLCLPLLCFRLCLHFLSASRLCRLFCSALISAGFSSLPSTRSCFAMFSALVSILVSDLVSSCSASVSSVSVTPLAHCEAFYTINNSDDVYVTSRSIKNIVFSAYYVY